MSEKLLMRRSARGAWRSVWAVCAILGLLFLSACAGSPHTVREMTPSPSPTVAPSPYPTPAGGYPALIHWSRTQPMTAAQLADWYISHMSLDEEIGQLFIVEYIGTTFDQNDLNMVQQLHAGGIILYAENLATKQQATDLIATSQAHATLPLLVTVDEEGGFVDRLQTLYGPRPSATDIGATGSTTYAYQQGAQVARDMTALGFNTDLAPDVDVQLVAGPDQLTRTFGYTPDAVTAMGSAYLNGLQDNGVTGTLKHFPGLGAANIDAHLGLPVIDRSYDQIESTELAPYRAMIASGQARMIMTTDLLMPALDPTNPAELSPAIINGVLRGQLGYDGVVMTDALYMQGISKTYSMPEAGVRALIAGCDMLLGPEHDFDVQAMAQAIKDAINNGRLTKARIDQSVRRILLLKMKMGMIPIPGAVSHGGSGVPGATPAPALALDTTGVGSLAARVPGLA